MGGLKFHVTLVASFLHSLALQPVLSVKLESSVFLLLNIHAIAIAYYQLVIESVMLP